jgi:benzoate-CoA ligase family protein
MRSIYEELPRTFNVAAYFLEENLKRGRAEASAYVYKHGNLSYGQVRTYVSRMGALLEDLGVEWENRVALLLPDSPELVISFLGAIWAGAVPVPINTAYRLADITYILEDCRAKVLITTREWRDRLSSQLSPFLRHIVLADEVPSLLETVNAVSREPEDAATTKDDAAFWLYTSGSTGRPKGAIHLHHDMVVCAELYGRNTIGLREGDLVYSIAKIPFAYGLGNTLYFPLHVGAAAVLSDALNAFDVIADLHTYRPSVFFGIPSIYSAILHVQDIAPLDAISLRLCVSAAEQLPPSIWYRWRERFGLEVCEGIGTTELLHIFLSNTAGQAKPGSTGRVVPGYEVRVVDEAGRPVAPGEVGDLEVGGESLMAGYWNRHAETRSAIFGETMKTGDKYLVDTEGYFYFAGRADDRFKIQGQWVLPFEVEDALLQYPGVQDAAVVAETDEGEDLPHIVAYLVLQPGMEAAPGLEQELKKHSRRKLQHFKVPRNFVVVERIERTATGKIDRKRLRMQNARAARGDV